MNHLPNIRHLAALAATLRYGSLTRAARAVHLTQPALTQAIRQLERQYGCAFFERVSDGMLPTEAARLLGPRAERAIGHIGSSRVTGTQLRAFMALARAGSFASAAAATGLSAPSLHRAVSDLSLNLGQRLVERRGRQLVFTEAGRRRRRDFGLALAELRSGGDEVANWLGRVGGRVVVGAMPLSRARWLPAALLKYSALNPQVDVVIIEGSHADLVGPLRDGEIDMLLGALREGPAVDDLHQRPVFVDAPKVIVRTGHALARRKVVSGGDLSAIAWILPGSDTPVRQSWDAMLASLGSHAPRVAIECGSVLTIRHLLLGSDAATLLSPAQFALEIEQGLLVAVEPPLLVSRHIGITSRAGWHPTGPQAAFVTMIEAEGFAYNS